MHIIFGQDKAQELESKYTVLELDSFLFKNTQTIMPAYCIIENVGILDLPDLDRMKNLHAELIKNYGQQNWTFCQQALEHLVGKWSGEVDSFYTELGSRVESYLQNPPSDGWTPVINKS